MAGVLVLNSCGTILATVSWKRAVVLVVDGRAVVHEADPERVIRSAHLEIPFPRIVRLVRWVYVKWTGKKPGAEACTKRGVLARDRWTCAYCGGKATTVDHVLPESRHGKSTWENLAGACEPCNAFKANRTPEEAGMKLRWQPWRPDVVGASQRRVWTGL